MKIGWTEGELLDKEAEREAKKGKGHSSSNLESWYFSFQVLDFMDKYLPLLPCTWSLGRRESAWDLPPEVIFSKLWWLGFWFSTLSFLVCCLIDCLIASQPQPIQCERHHHTGCGQCSCSSPCHLNSGWSTAPPRLDFQFQSFWIVLNQTNQIDVMWL